MRNKPSFAENTDVGICKNFTIIDHNKLCCKPDICLVNCSENSLLQSKNCRYLSEHFFYRFCY
jgi:hypothetical protein